MPRAFLSPLLLASSVLAAVVLGTSAAWAQSCGDPKTGSCCVEQFGPSCSDADCCAAICKSDDFCCTVQWDDLCAASARQLCAGCETNVCGNPLAGGCCESNDTPGCQDAQCCEQVCGVDPFCCDEMWDFTCAERAIASCSACSNPADLNGDGVVNSADLSILLNAWDTPDADLNGDGTTGSPDLAVLLNGWS
ncbi:MAG: hypothetical protein RLY21_216 [Planctomycetota bacterium]